MRRDVLFLEEMIEAADLRRVLAAQDEEAPADRLPPGTRTGRCCVIDQRLFVLNFAQPQLCWLLST